METSDKGTQVRTKKAPEHASGPILLLLLIAAMAVDSGMGAQSGSRDLNSVQNDQRERILAAASNIY